MVDTISFSIDEYKKDGDDIKGKVIIFINQNPLFKATLSLVEFKDELDTWLNLQVLDLFTIGVEENRFNLYSEDGEEWFFKTFETSTLIDIDEMILELWKLSIEIEHNLSKKFNGLFI